MLGEYGKKQKAESKLPVPKPVSVPTAATTSNVIDGVRFTKIAIICEQSKFESLKQAFAAIGVTGLTVTNVLGCGLPHGTAKYRGIEIEATLLPKVKIDVVVSKIPVETVIQTAKEILYTGNSGDGKIFTYNGENIVRIGTDRKRGA